MPKRTTLTSRAGTFYVRRSPSGQFSEEVEKGKSLAADRRTKAKTTVKPGYGDEGDQARPARAKRRAVTGRASAKKVSAKKTTVAKKTAARKTATRKAPAKHK